MLDSHNHSEAVGHLELATGKRQARTFSRKNPTLAVQCVFRKVLLLALSHKLPGMLFTIFTMIYP